MQRNVWQYKLKPVTECVPESIRNKKQKADEMTISIRSIYEQLKENYAEGQGYNFNLDDINNMLQTLREEEVKCQGDFDYYHKVVSELLSSKFRFVHVYLCDNLIYTTYIKMKESVDRYLKFLQEAQDPNVYFEKQKQQQQEKPSGFVAAKSNFKSDKNILGDGRSLPRVKPQECDENLRHRNVKSTRSYR